MSKKTIKSLSDLEREIAVQKLKVKYLEQQMDQNFEHLQKNYGSMFKKSLVNVTIDGGSLASSLVRNVLGNERLQQTFGTAVGKVGDRLADWIASLTDKLSKKEEK